MAQSGAGEGATTTLALWVNSEGTVRRVEIRKSCGRRECDAAAMSRAFEFKFPPSVDAATQSAPRLFVIGSDVKELAQ
jgi:TonB family protein